MGGGWGRWCAGKPPRGNVKNGALKKSAHFLPLPAANTPRLEGAPLHLCQRPATAAPARTPAPVPFLGILALLARLRSRTPRARKRIRGELGLASQQCSRSCTASANQLQLQCTAKTHSPVPPDLKVQRPQADAQHQARHVCWRCVTAGVGDQCAAAGAAQHEWRRRPRRASVARTERHYAHQLATV